MFWGKYISHRVKNTVTWQQILKTNANFGYKILNANVTTKRTPNMGYASPYVPLWWKLLHHILLTNYKKFAFDFCICIQFFFLACDIYFCQVTFASLHITVVFCKDLLRQKIRVSVRWLPTTLPPLLLLLNSSFYTLTIPFLLLLLLILLTIRLK